jgi:hypothetical protein
LVGRNKEQEFEFNRKLQEKEVELAELKKQIVQVAKPKEQEVEEMVIKQQQERIIKLVEEDINKPRESRREMVKEDLEEWLIEDPSEAQAWIARRERRREKEIEGEMYKLKAKDTYEDIQQKQNASISRLVSKYPNVRPEKRGLELKAQGKTIEETTKILSEEFPEYKLANDICAENPSIYKEENFGDILATEIEKRLTKKEPIKKVFTEDEVKKAVQEAIDMEIKRRESVDSTVRSNGGGNLVGSKLTPQEEELKLEVDKANKRGSNIDFNKVLERHRARAGSFGRDEEDRK